jgi:hypothetical protein
MASRMLPNRQKMLNRSDEKLSPHLSMRFCKRKGAEGEYSKRYKERGRNKQSQVYPSNERHEEVGKRIEREHEAQVEVGETKLFHHES